MMNYTSTYFDLNPEPQRLISQDGFGVSGKPVASETPEQPAVGFGTFRLGFERSDPSVVLVTGVLSQRRPAFCTFSRGLARATARLSGSGF